MGATETTRRHNADAGGRPSKRRKKALLYSGYRRTVLFFQYEGAGNALPPNYPTLAGSDS